MVKLVISNVGPQLGSWGLPTLIEKKQPEVVRTIVEHVGLDTKGKRSSRLRQSQQIQMLQKKQAIKGQKRIFCF